MKWMPHDYSPAALPGRVPGRLIRAIPESSFYRQCALSTSSSVPMLSILFLIGVAPRRTYAMNSMVAVFPANAPFCPVGMDQPAAAGAA